MTWEGNAEQALLAALESNIGLCINIFYVDNLKTECSYYTDVTNHR